GGNAVAAGVVGEEGAQLVGRVVVEEVHGEQGEVVLGLDALGGVAVSDALHHALQFVPRGAVLGHVVELQRVHQVGVAVFVVRRPLRKGGVPRGCAPQGERQQRAAVRMKGRPHGSVKVPAGAKGGTGGERRTYPRHAVHPRQPTAPPSTRRSGRKSWTFDASRHHAASSPLRSSPIILLHNVRIHQNENVVLSNVDLTVKKGEFLYLIGRTGSGKSSLMRTLYGDLPLREGEGHVAGFDLTKLKRKQTPYLRRKLGIVFQDFQLLG